MENSMEEERYTDTQMGEMLRYRSASPLWRVIRPDGTKTSLTHTAPSGSWARLETESSTGGATVTEYYRKSDDGLCRTIAKAELDRSLARILTPVQWRDAYARDRITDWLCGMVGSGEFDTFECEGHEAYACDFPESHYIAYVIDGRYSRTVHALKVYMQSFIHNDVGDMLCDIRLANLIESER